MDSSEARNAPIQPVNYDIISFYQFRRCRLMTTILNKNFACIFDFVFLSYYFYYVYHSYYSR